MSEAIIEKLKKALSYYADEGNFKAVKENYMCHGDFHSYVSYPVVGEGGEIARKALEEAKDA